MHLCLHIFLSFTVYCIMFCETLLWDFICGINFTDLLFPHLYETFHLSVPFVKVRVCILTDCLPHQHACCLKEYAEIFKPTRHTVPMHIPKWWGKKDAQIFLIIYIKFRTSQTHSTHLSTIISLILLSRVLVQLLPRILGHT